MSESARTAVFLGPTLCQDEAAQLLPAHYEAPARQGDVYRILARGVTTIVLIDGVFHSTPSVWQRELLHAMEDGVTVIGASSMGALRAAELYEYGMVGVGKVFSWYRDGVLCNDDAVAVRHADSEHQFRCLSEPLVNIRATIEHARGLGVLDETQASLVWQVACAMPYGERSYPALEQALATHWSEEILARWKIFTCQQTVDIKAEDARQALILARTLGQERQEACMPPAHASIWGTARLEYAGFYVNQRCVLGHQVAELAWRSPELWAIALVPPSEPPLEWLCQRLAARFFAVAFARELGTTPELPDVPDAAWPPHDLAANGLNAHQHRRLERAARLAEAVFAVHAPGEEGKSWPGQCALLGRWAQQRGIGLDVSGSAEAVGSWLCRMRPAYFGYDWSPQLALLAELSRLGKAAIVAQAVPA